MCKSERKKLCSAVHNLDPIITTYPLQGDINPFSSSCSWAVLREGTPPFIRPVNTPKRQWEGLVVLLKTAGKHWRKSKSERFHDWWSRLIQFLLRHKRGLKIEQQAQTTTEPGDGGFLRTTEHKCVVGGLANPQISDFRTSLMLVDLKRRPTWSASYQLHLSRW